MLGNMAEPLNKTRKEQIISSAASLFKEKGYNVTTMRDIALFLNIEAASLYHHIKSKEEILETICFAMADNFLTAISEVNDIYFNAEEKLRMAIKNHVHILTENQAQSAVFMHEWRHLPGASLRDFKEMRNNYEEGFRKIIEEGINEDLFSAVDLKFAVLSILSSVNWINEWYSPEGKMTPDEIASKISDFVISGLRKTLVTDPHYKP